IRLFPVGGNDVQLIAACDQLKIALRLDPGNPQAHLTYGKIYLAHGSFLWAIKDLDKAARVQPNKEVFALLGEACEKAGETEKAVDSYRKALAYGEDSKLSERIKSLGPKEPVVSARAAAPANQFTTAPPSSSSPPA